MSYVEGYNDIVDWPCGKKKKKKKKCVICFGLEKQNGVVVNRCIVGDSEIKMHVFDQDLNPRLSEHNAGLLTSPPLNFILVNSPKIRCSLI
jgi:hypothetical protein